MPQIVDYLLNAGICDLPDVYSKEEISAINAAVDPLLSSRLAERRAYVHPEEIFELGIWKNIFTSRMLAAVFSMMPDPVLYHCHIYEIAANATQSHIFADSLMGWHRDPDSEYVEGDPTHLSVFIYLTDVGPEDGAFEFVPAVPPTKWLHSKTPYIAVQGPRGYTFAWARSFYHRASPNRGPVRRRLIKFSVQRNAFTSIHLGNPHFQKLIEYIPGGDARMDLLLGRYQGKAAPKLEPLPEPTVAPVATNQVLDLSSVDLTKAQLRDKLRKVKGMIQPKKNTAQVAYD